MTRQGPKSGGGRPRRRLVALALLLVLSLVLAAGLALQSIATARRHRATAQRTLEDYAAFAAFILASQSYRQIGGAVAAAFAGWQPGRGPVVPEGASCSAGTTWFDFPPGDTRSGVRGAPLSAERLEALRDTLGNAMNLLREAGWRFRFIRMAGGPPDGYFITSYRTPAGKWGLRGFGACLSGTGSPLHAVAAREAALPPGLTGNLAADSLFSVVVTGAGSPVYASPVRYQSPYRGAARLGTEFGDLTLEVALRPEIASRLVIGGLPSSPTPMAVALLGLSALMVVTALWQLRREYQLIAIRSEFVSNVSHELRTPLSQILIFTDLLKLGRLRSGAERERALDVIDQEVRRLIRLVENVLQFSGAGRRSRRIAAGPVALSPLVTDTLDAFRPLATARGVALRSDVPDDAAVRADPSAIRQILLNLLDNAVKYGPRGQTVSVGVHRENGHTLLAVDDQGPGIPLEDRDRVWEGYFRLQRESRSAIAGSGIGLSVVRSLATDQGGRTWVEDGDTGGARFVVALISAPIDEAAGPAERTDPAPGAEP